MITACRSYCALGSPLLRWVGISLWYLWVIGLLQRHCPISCLTYSNFGFFFLNFSTILVSYQSCTWYFWFYVVFALIMSGCKLHWYVVWFHIGVGFVLLQNTFAPIKSPFSFSNYKTQPNSLKLQQKLSFIIIFNLFCNFLIIFNFEGGYSMTLKISSQPNLSAFVLIWALWKANTILLYLCFSTKLQKGGKKFTYLLFFFSLSSVEGSSQSHMHPMLTWVQCI